MNVAVVIVISSVILAFASLVANAHERVQRVNESMTIVSDRWRAQGYWVYMERRRWLKVLPVLVIESVSAHPAKYGPTVMILNRNDC